MTNISYSTALSLTPAAAWARLGDPAGLHAWHPAIASSPVDADGERIITLGDGAVVREKILSVDNEALVYEYAVLESPFPFTNYKGVFKIEADGSGSRVTWSSSFEAGEHAADMETALTGLYAAGLDAVAAEG